MESSLETKESLVSDMRLEPIKSSPYISVLSAHLISDKRRAFHIEFPRVHDSVSILLYHVNRRSLILVRQFRPAVFLQQKIPRGLTSPPTAIEFPDNCVASLGYTYELCDGILDQPSLNAIEIAKKEILEECGYDLPYERIELITKHRSINSGSLQTLFYAEIDDHMKVSEGGGNIEEHEHIQVIYMPIERAKNLVYDENIQRTTDLMFSILWFLENKLQK